MVIEKKWGGGGGIFLLKNNFSMLYFQYINFPVGFRNEHQRIIKTRFYKYKENT